LIIDERYNRLILEFFTRFGDLPRLKTAPSAATVLTTGFGMV
jgi:hypothetical protein